jgi:hypothetical protein
MQSMIVETDMAGNYVGSSYGWATEIGQVWLALFAQRKLNGEQLFDESWAKYVATPTNTSNGVYGAHFG